MIVEREISLLRVDAGKSVFRIRPRTEALVHTEHGLEPPKKTLFTAKARKAISGFNPVTVCVGATCPFGANAEMRIRRLPPDMHSRKILVHVLQKAIVRSADFQPWLSEIDATAAPGRTLGAELQVGAGGRKVSSVINVDLAVGVCRSA